MRFVGALALIAGCASGNTELDVTLTIDPALVGVAPAKVDVASGAPDSFDDKLPVNRPLAAVERIAYVTPTHDGSLLALTITFLDGNGAPLGCGQGSGKLSGGSVAVPIAVHPGACAGGADGGSDAGADAATDAAMPDLSGTDGNPGTVSSCANLAAHSDWFFCDGFDSQPLDATKWNLLEGTITVDTPPQLKRGTMAAHVTLPYVDGGAPRMEASIMAATLSADAEIYARVFLLLPANTLTIDPVSYILHAYDLNSNGLLLGYSNSLISESTTARSGGNMPFGSWVCLEWKFPTAAGGMQVWMNDAEVLPLAAGDLGFSPTLTSFQLGSDDTIPGHTQFDYWIDDVVLSKSRVGCTN
jgi:hypothetical protein